MEGGKPGSPHDYGEDVVAQCISEELLCDVVLAVGVLKSQIEPVLPAQEI